MFSGEDKEALKQKMIEFRNLRIKTDYRQGYRFFELSILYNLTEDELNEILFPPGIQ